MAIICYSKYTAQFIVGIPAFSSCDLAQLFFWWLFSGDKFL